MPCQTTACASTDIYLEFIDNVEWQDGYNEIWALVPRRFNDDQTPKASVAVVREMIAE